jgi:hypothetical protein
VELPLEIDNIVPKKDVFSVAQLGHGPFKIENNYILVYVMV